MLRSKILRSCLREWIAVNFNTIEPFHECINCYYSILIPDQYQPWIEPYFAGCRIYGNEVDSRDKNRPCFTLHPDYNESSECGKIIYKLDNHKPVFSRAEQIQILKDKYNYEYKDVADRVKAIFGEHAPKAEEK